MNFSEICIKRPVLTTMLSLVIILVGAVTWNRLGVRQYPQIDEPKVSVVVSYEGAPAAIMEAQVTKPLEDQLKGIEGLDTITSRSSSENTAITMSFKLNRSADAAASDVRDRVAKARLAMPQDISEPRIKKADAEATPIIFLAVTGDKYHPKEMADYVERFIKSEIEVIPGVSGAEPEGGGRYEMHITLDPVRLAANRITAEDVAVALKKQNVEKPAGRLTTTDREIMVTTTATLNTEEEFNNLVLGERNGHLIKLRDVGSAKLDAIDKYFRVTFNGKPAVSIPVIKQSTANPLEVAKSVKELLPKLQAEMPEGMKIDVAYDTSTFIESSIDHVYSSIIEATILVILVVLVFLRSGKASLIPIVTIPICLIGTFGVMYFCGFTINTLTLLALVLAVGLVVDDAIVMLENIYRHIEDGMEPYKAALVGAKEISFAVIAMTFTLTAVYAPIALVTGLSGKLFTEFSITLAAAVVISGFVALTLSPMMCARLLSHSPSLEGSTKPVEKISHQMGMFLEKLDLSYASFLRIVLDKRRLLLGGSLAIVAVGWFLVNGISIFGYPLLSKLPSELTPREDQGLMKVRSVAPQGARVEFIDRYMKEVDKVLEETPEIVNRLMPSQAPGESYGYISLKPWEDRKRKTKEVVEALKDPLENITGIQARPYASGSNLVASGTGYPFEVYLQTNKSLTELDEVAQLYWAAIAKNPIFEQSQAEIGQSTQEFAVQIDRDKAASLGVDPSLIAETMDTMISGRAASKFKRENKRYDVRVELEEGYRRTAEDVSALFIRGVKGRSESMVPLAEVMKIIPKLAIIEIVHFDGLRSIRFMSKIKDGYGLGDALKAAEEIKDQFVPEGYWLDFGGETRRYFEESSNALLIFGLAIAFIYMVLASQYESFVDPLIILLSVPLSLVGGVIALKLSGGTMNLFSQIGFLTLVGLISKHGILIVDFANQKRQEGFSRVEAVIEASKMRLRPILMTTFAMVLGALPLAIGSGAGAESRGQIGWVIVGGMTMGTFFTLFVVPAVYTLLSQTRKVRE